MATEDDMTAPAAPQQPAEPTGLIPVEQVFKALEPDIDALQDQEFPDDRAGNRLRISHVAGLRKVKAAVEATRKEAKAGALDYGRRLDERAKALSGRVEALMAPHVKILDRIKAEEKARKAAHEEALQQLRELFVPTNEPRRSEVLLEQLREMQSLYEGRQWEEFQAQALALATEGSHALNQQIDAAREREAQEAELERLRKIEAEQRAAEQERKRQAAEAARQEQERKNRIEQEERERQARIEREEQERVARIAAEEAQRKREREREQREERARFEREMRDREEALRAQQAAIAEQQARMQQEAEQEAEQAPDPVEVAVVSLSKQLEEAPLLAGALLEFLNDADDDMAVPAALDWDGVIYRLIAYAIADADDVPNRKRIVFRLPEEEMDTLVASVLLENER